MLDIGFVLMLAAWSAGVGLWVLRRFGPLPQSPSDSLALAIPIGLGVLSLATLGLGELGELDAGRIESVLGFGALFGAAGLMRWLIGAARTLGHADQSNIETVGSNRLNLAFAIALAATLLGTLLTALAPVTDGDALCYHLQVPKLFLEHLSVTYDPDLHETIYPLLTEMLYAVALAFRGPVACRLVQWLFGIVFALNVSALARPSLGLRSYWAGTIALLVPAISNGMGAPLNDVALAAYGTSALVAWSRFREQPSLRGAALTGLLTGLAMGVKYPALVLAGLIGLTVGPGFFSRVFFRFSSGGTVLPLSTSRRGRKMVASLVDRWSSEIDKPEPGKKRRRRLIHLAAFVVFAWGTGGAWYVRAFVHTGNPVHPFFRETFAGAGLAEVLGPEKRPMPVDVWHLLTAIAPLTLEPDKFDSFSHQFGPIFLLFLPALFWERPPRRILALAAMGYGFLVLCMTQRQSMRFLLIAIGPLSVAVAWLVQTWWQRRSMPGRLLIGTLVLVLACESALALSRARHGLRVVIGAESTEHYLARREPTFLVGQWVNTHLPASAKLIGQDHRGFYIPRDYTMELAHRRRTGLGLRGESPEAIVAAFRKSGFTHVLFCPPETDSTVEFDPTLLKLLGPWLANHGAVYREDLTDGDGVTRQYAIYPLNDDRVANVFTGLQGLTR